MAQSLRIAGKQTKGEKPEKRGVGKPDFAAVDFMLFIVVGGGNAGRECCRQLDFRDFAGDFLQQGKREMIINPVYAVGILMEIIVAGFKNTISECQYADGSPMVRETIFVSVFPLE